MENKDEKSVDEPVGRRTRSGKTVTPTKPTAKKTRKKVMLVEVEVSDDEDSNSVKTLEEKSETDRTSNVEDTCNEDDKALDTLNTDDIEAEQEIDHNNLSNSNMFNDMPSGDNNIVANGSEDNEICTVIENDVFLGDTDNDIQQEEMVIEKSTTVELVASNQEEIVEESVVESCGPEISELIETDTDKIADENTSDPIISEPMDVDENIIIGSEETQSKEEDTCTEQTESVKSDVKQNTKEKLKTLEEDECNTENDDRNIKDDECTTKEDECNTKVDEEPSNEEDESNTKSTIKEDKSNTKSTNNADESTIKDHSNTKENDSNSSKMEQDEEKMDITEEIKGTNEKMNIPSADPDAENISEDELPTVQVAKVPETEEVSDEELPGPKRAELPADTEVVSEDELPAVKKEGTKRKITEGDYDPGSPTSESEVSAKKPFLDADAEKEKEKAEKPKKLPELDKYWKAVNDDPSDFTGWTYLLQYVDQENDMEAAREAYDAFLSHYPYCYGYWRKYADYEKRKGNKKKCEEVFERGLKAIPLSVDLWIHYLTYVRTSKADEEDFIRSQFERALSACGLEFRSDRLWDSYIKWETDGKRLQFATAIYDRLLATPTQGYTTHFDNFQEHVSTNPPNKILEVDEFLALRKEVKHMLKHEGTSDSADKPDVPPGEDTEEVSSDEETKAIRERIISIRRKIHKNTVTAVTGRWNFEEGIKRPYFHVKPLERCQLKNWQEYLDYEIEHGDQTRMIVLFERCLIACALYEEFWLRFVHYLEGLKDPELHSKIKDVYERACTIHHIKKPNLHLQWAMFEEGIKNYNKAAEILANIEKSVPNLLQVANRRINLERRREDYEKCSQLYEHYIANSKNKIISTNLAIKYARFCYRILKNVDKALEVLNSALAKDSNNPRLYLQIIDMTMQKEVSSEKEVVRLLDAFLEKDSTELEQKILFAQRKLEYLEDFGSEIKCIQSAYDDYQKYIKLNKESKKKEVKSDAAGKKEKNPPLPSSQASTYGNYSSYGNSSSASPYQYSSSQQGQYNYSQYGQSDQYQYGNWQYPQGSYSGYNQWSGYSGGYGY